MKTGVKPKIIVSSYDDLKNPHYGGGGAVAIHEVFKRLTDSFDVTIITAKYLQSRNEVVDNILYKRIGTNIFGPKIGQFIFQLLLPYIITRQKFDLWVENFTPPFSTSCLQFFTKKPVVGLVHMLSGEDMWRKYKLPFYVVEHWGLKVYKYFIVLSQNSKREIINFNKKASFLIAPNGVDIPSQLESYTKRDKKYLIFLGRIEVNQKGLDLLIQAISLIKDKLTIKVKIAGDGHINEIKRLQQLISFYNLQDKIELIGRVSGKTKQDLFKQALLAIIPSRFETFSLSSLEILSFGIPLSVFDIEGLMWIPKDCAIKVPAFNVDKLAQVILTLYQDENLRNKLSKKGFKLAQKYSWENTTLMYKNCFERILQ